MLTEHLQLSDFSVVVELRKTIKHMRSYKLLSMCVYSRSLSQTDKVSVPCATTNRYRPEHRTGDVVWSTCCPGTGLRSVWPAAVLEYLAWPESSWLSQQHRSHLALGSEQRRNSAAVALRLPDTIYNKNYTPLLPETTVRTASHMKHNCPSKCCIIISWRSRASRSLCKLRMVHISVCYLKIN